VTAIAAVVHRGQVWLAGDSRAGNDAFVVAQRRPKVALYGVVAVGAAGDARFDPVLAAVDWSRDWLTEIRKHAAAIDVPLDCGELVIGHRGRLYYYDSGSIFEAAERYAACGSGALVCIGYLAASEGLPPQNRVRGAVAAAAKHVPTVGGKVTVIHTEKKQ